MKSRLILCFLAILSIASASYPENSQLWRDRTIVSDQEIQVDCKGYSGKASVYKNSQWTASLPGASWIWKNTNKGEPAVCKFYIKFYIYPGLDNALLEVAGDDRYITFFNKKNAYCSCQSSCWFKSHIKRCFVEKLLGMGNNVMEIFVKNDDGLAGLMFKLSLLY